MAQTERITIALPSETSPSSRAPSKLAITLPSSEVVCEALHGWRTKRVPQR